MNNPYFDLSRNGCMDEATKLGNVNCIYTGPVKQEPAAEVQIVQDLDHPRRGRDRDLGRRCRLGAARHASARQANIPVITFDADAPQSQRQAYVGTDNLAMGKALAEQLIKAHPTPGTYAMISGGPAAENLDERVDGVREVLRRLAGRKSAARPPSATTTARSPCSR